MSQFTAEVKPNMRRATGAIYVRFYAHDWRSECFGLSLEQEGLLIRFYAYIASSGRRVDLDDSRAAKLMGVHTNAYRKVRNQLAASGHIIRHADGWGAPRAERELLAAVGTATAWLSCTTQDGQADADQRRPADENTVGDSPARGSREHRNTPPVSMGDTRPDASQSKALEAVSVVDTPQDTPPDTRIVFSKKPNKINGAFKEPRSSSQEKKNSPLTPLGGFERVEIADGTIRLAADLRAFWTEKLGSAERLDLALIEALPNLNTLSRLPLEAQLGRLLARTAGEKLDRDSRYAAAVKSRGGDRPAGGGTGGNRKPTVMDILDRMERAASAPVGGAA